VKKPDFLSFVLPVDGLTMATDCGEKAVGLLNAVLLSQ